MSNFKFKKKFGQNFLKDNSIIEKIVNLADLDSQTDVIEIGVGSANMTVLLAEKAGRVLGIEIDTTLIPILEKKLFDCPNVFILFKDFLEIDLQKTIKDNLPNSKKIVVVANIPYYITSPIINKLLNSNYPFANIILMVQKEVAHRLIATPNTKDYGVLSIYVSVFTNINIAFDVNKKYFIPVPKVDSSVVNMKLKDQELSHDEINDVMKIVKISFQNRRKQLKNNLFVLTKDLLQRQEILNILDKLFNSVTIRAQELNFCQFIELNQELKKHHII